jgi:hypothetical protein
MSLQMPLFSLERYEALDFHGETGHEQGLIN